MYPMVEQITTRYFKPVQADALLELEHAASLKGLFKGKGLDNWGSDYERLRNELIAIGRQQILTQVKAYPFALLPIELAIQTTGSGTAFLRWRRKDRSEMGVHLWDELMVSSAVSASLINDLYALETQRILLNMQISVTHTISRRLEDCTGKLAHAEKMFLTRLNTL